MGDLESCQTLGRRIDREGLCYGSTIDFLKPSSTFLSEALLNSSPHGLDKIVCVLQNNVQKRFDFVQVFPFQVFQRLCVNMLVALLT